MQTRQHVAKQSLRALVDFGGTEIMQEGNKFSQDFSDAVAGRACVCLCCHEPLSRVAEDLAHFQKAHSTHAFF